jgi:outer membrane biosynthesis protein TonB
MGRPRKRRKQEVSLFPFLDILACVIGNLILIITAVVLEQVDTKPVAEAARIDDLVEEAERQQAKAAELREQLDQLLERSGVASERLEEIRAKIAAAKQQLVEAKKREEQATKPVERPSEMTAEIKKLEEERKKIEAEIKELERQIAERQKPPQQMIAILPPGAGDGPRKGVFVEAAKDGLVVHEGDKPWQVPTGKVASDPRFKALLDKVKGDPDAIVTFLVRSDGLASLAAGQKAATAAGARSGRVPLPGQGTLDLSGAK